MNKWVKMEELLEAFRKRNSKGRSQGKRAGGPGNGPGRGHFAECSERNPAFPSVEWLKPRPWLVSAMRHSFNVTNVKGAAPASEMEIKVEGLIMG